MDEARPRPLVLVVDDDAHLREVVRFSLEAAGLEVEEAPDGKQALERVEARFPDLVLLDVLMPELDGVAVCRTLRSNPDPARRNLPIVFLSSRGDEIDRVLGLDLGGDDYIAKPFSPRELVSRIKAVLRRTRQEPDEPEQLRLGRLLIEPARHRASVDGQPLEFTATEYRLLLALARNPGLVLSRERMVSLGYQGSHHVSDRTLDSHVRRIRQKLRDLGLDPIETVHGVGFRLELAGT
jgi:two-component system OmpR family response regulator